MEDLQLNQMFILMGYCYGKSSHLLCNRSMDTQTMKLSSLSKRYVYLTFCAAECWGYETSGLDLRVCLIGANSENGRLGRLGICV